MRATFKDDAKNLGYLAGIDQQNTHVALDANHKKFGVNKTLHETDLNAQSMVELPLWLALPLAQRDIADLRPPEYLGDKYVQALQAGPEILNFRK